MSTDRMPQPGEDLVTWAVETGRVHAGRADSWRQRLQRQPELGRVLSAMALGAKDAAAWRQTSEPPPQTQTVSAARPPAPLADRNPLVAAAAQREPSRYAAAAAKAQAPTLFQGGDLPPFTASGIDPAALLNVPWQARHAVAAATTPAEAYSIVQTFTGTNVDEGTTAASLDFADHPANADYERRVTQWLVDAMTEDELYDAVFGDRPAPAAATTDEDELMAALFGEGDTPPAA